MAGADDSLGCCALVQGLCGLVQVFLVPRSGRVLARKDGRTAPPWDAEISSGDSPTVAWEPRFDDQEEDLPPVAPAAGADLWSTSYQEVGRARSRRDVSGEEDSPPVSRELRSDDQEEEEEESPVAPAVGADLCSTSYQEVGRTGSRRDVSGEEEDSPPVSRFDDQEEDLPPVARNSPPQQMGLAGGVEDEDDDDDCVILDGDPHGAVAMTGAKEGSAEDCSSDEELQIVAEKGQVACRDFPHSRHLCSNMPFSTTSHDKHCTMCYCFVCDALAPCSYWGKGLWGGDHCHATDKETKWETLREAFRFKNLPASHPEEETVVYPAMASLARLSLGNQTPLQNVVTQNQHTQTSARASLNVAPTVNAPREGSGTSNAHTAQISHPLALTVSASRASSAARVQSGTSNGHSAQVTRLVEPTASAPRPHLAEGGGRGTSSVRTAQISHPLALTVSAPRTSSATRVQSGTSNGHSAQVTQRVEPTISAPRPHPAAGAGRGTSNAHTALITHPEEPTVSTARPYYAARTGRGTSSGHSAQVTQLVEPTVSAPRPHPAAGAGRGTSNAHTALITHPVEPTVSAARPYYVARTGRGTNNAHTSHITRPVEPTVSSTRAYPARRTGRDIGNAHTALITRPVEQTVSASRVYPAARVESDSSNAHSGQNAHSAPANGNRREPDAPEGTTVYVGNLPNSIDNERLKLSFQHAGVVLFSKIMYDRETGRSRGFGYVTMNTVQEAETAVRIYHGSEVYGRPLTVNIAPPRGGAQADTARRQSGSPLKIFVCNLPTQVDHSRLKELFSKHGKVVDARVIYECRGGDLRSKGFGFVTMATEEESYSAIHALNKQILEGRALVVKVAMERPERGCLSPSNQTPLQSAASQNQSAHTSVRASLNLPPRARSGTSNAYTSQVTQRLDPTASAPRPREHPLVG